MKSAPARVEPRIQYRDENVAVVKEFLLQAYYYLKFNAY
jgi:hypothetical protein